MQNNYIILLDEGERLMTVHALQTYIAHRFLGSGKWVNRQARENVRARCVELLDKLNSVSGGVKLKCREFDPHHIYQALLFYSFFVPTTKAQYEGLEHNDYAKLGINIDLRNKHSDIFDFDPQYYHPPRTKPVLPLKIDAGRTIIVRQQQGIVDYVSEFKQFSDETLQEYEIRVHEELAQLNKHAKFFAIKDSELSNYEISDKCFYHATK